MIEPVVRETLGQQVLRRLQDYIVTQGLGPGDRLPTERALAATLGVSSNTVREALKSLETIGALVRRPRHGTVLQPIDFSVLAGLARFQLLHCPADFTELFVARRLLEVSVLPLVVQHATDADFERMDEANQTMEAEIHTDGRGIEADMAFHEALLAAASNKFLSQFGALLQEFFRQSRGRTLSNPSESLRSLEDHRKIVQALRVRDVEQAQRLMEGHLDQYLRRGIIPAPNLPARINGGPAADSTERRMS